MRRLFISLVALWHTSCASGHVSPPPSPPPVVLQRAPYLGTIRIWVAPDADIKAEWVEAGCWYWESEGIRCLQTFSPGDADIRIGFDYSPCEAVFKRRVDGEKMNAIARPYRLKPECQQASGDRNAAGEGQGMVALASLFGDITLFPVCVARMKGGAFSPSSISRIVAHEIGHEMGILSHVPPTCDDACMLYDVDADGKPLCGVAVMNSVPADVPAITPEDRRAFRTRTPQQDPVHP